MELLGAGVTGGDELSDVGATNGTRVLWKNKECSYPLNCVPSASYPRTLPGIAPYFSLL